MENDLSQVPQELKSIPEHRRRSVERAELFDKYDVYSKSAADDCTAFIQLSDRLGGRIFLPPATICWLESAQDEAGKHTGTRVFYETFVVSEDRLLSSSRFQRISEHCRFSDKPMVKILYHSVLEKPEEILAMMGKKVIRSSLCDENPENCDTSM